MEPEIYARHGVDARFVGHPLADAIALEPDRGAARAALGIPFHAPVLAVLPGSRLGEIERMLPAFLEAAALVSRDVDDLQLLVPAANAQCRAAIERALVASPFPASRCLLLDGDAQRAMIAADVVLLASGTAALEAMLCKRPMVVGHRIANSTYRLVKGLGLLKSRFVSLPNVLAGEALVPELLQDDCTPPKLAAAVLAWFREPEAVAALRPRFRAIHETLRRDASARAAEAVLA
jgi:lipid-A-disaccharide synthase